MEVCLARNAGVGPGDAMLTNILPGLRDVRAPLAAGYVWLLSIYIAVAPSAPHHPYHGIWRTLSRLEHVFSTVGIGVALSFLAYLLGAISQSIFHCFESPLLDVTTRALSRIGRWDMSGPFHKEGVRARADAVRVRLEALTSALEDLPEPLTLASAAVAMELHRRSQNDEARGGDRNAEALLTAGRSLPLADSTRVSLRPVAELLKVVFDAMRKSSVPEAGDDAARARERDLQYPYGYHVLVAREAAETYLSTTVLDELKSARMSMIDDKPSHFSEVDRLQSEADFRMAVASPLAGLSVVCVWRATWWLALAVVAAASALAISGSARSRSANDSLVEALRLKDARTPSLDRVDESATALRDESRRSQEGSEGAGTPRRWLRRVLVNGSASS